MARKDIYKDGIKTRFSSTYQPPNKGRRRDKLKEFIDKERLSANDLLTILEGLLMNYSFKDFEDIHNPASGHEELPILVAAYMKAIMTDHRKGTTDTIDRLMDRVYGRPTNPVDLKSGSGLMVTMITPEERKKRIEELLKKCEPEKPDRQRTGRTPKSS